MKKIALLSVLTFGFILMAFTIKPSPNSTPTRFMLDTSKSTISWKGYKIFKSDLSAHNGIAKLTDGSLTVDLKKAALLSGKATIDMNSFESIDLNGSPDMKAKLDGHLKSADFLDVAKFPTINFEITGHKNIKSKKYNYLISGNLTLKGVTKNISFKAMVKGDAKKIELKSEAFEINRQDFNITYKGSAESIIKDDVEIQLNLVAIPVPVK